MQEQQSKSQLTALPYIMRYLVTCFQTSMQVVYKHLHREKSNSSSSEDSFLKKHGAVSSATCTNAVYHLHDVYCCALLKALAAQSNSAVI